MPAASRVARPSPVTGTKRPSRVAASRANGSLRDLSGANGANGANGRHASVRSKAAKVIEPAPRSAAARRRRARPEAESRPRQLPPDLVLERVDGRHLRSARSRDLVVDAILDLLREGNMRPSAYEVASRAGVSERTVFRHFEDLEQLFVAAADHQAQRIAALLDPPPTEGGRSKRINELVRRRAVLYEEITPVRRAALRHSPFHSALRSGLDRLHLVLRQQMEAALALELDELSTRRRREVVEALDVAVSWSAWEALRADQRLPLARAAATMELTLSALLAVSCDA